MTISFFLSFTFLNQEYAKATLKFRIRSSSTTAHNSILSVQLQAYYEHLFEHASFLDTVSVFPVPSFPGKTQETLLGQVVRKKLEPEVEEWVSQAAEETENVVGPGHEEEGKSQRQLLDLWDQTPLISNECAKEDSWGGDFTNKGVEEGRKNVVTGMKRKLKDLDEDEADEDEDEKEKKSVRMILVQDKGSEGEKKDGGYAAGIVAASMTRGPPEAKSQSHWFWAEDQMKKPRKA